MSSAKITFSNGVSVDVKENDLIIPIVLDISKDKPFARQADPVEITYHISFGLIPSIMDIVCSCDFFYINNGFDIAYGAKTVVSVENN